MRHVLVLLVAVSLTSCGSSFRRTMLPNGYSVDTIAGRFGAIVKPDAPSSRTFTSVWPAPGDRRDEYCGAFGWQGSWVVCEVVKHDAGTESATGRFAVLDTATGTVELLDSRVVLAERLQRALVEVPPLVRDYPSTTTVR